MNTACLGVQIRIHIHWKHEEDWLVISFPLCIHFSLGEQKIVINSKEWSK